MHPRDHMSLVGAGINGYLVLQPITGKPGQPWAMSDYCRHWLNGYLA